AKIDEVTREHDSAKPGTIATRKRAGQIGATDRTRLAELESLSHSSEFVEELIGVFIDDAQRLMELMREAHRDGDLPRMKDYAHAFKGSASSIGATQLYEIGQQINQFSVTDDMQNAGHLLRQAKDEFLQVRSELLAYLEKRAREQAIH
ncbi:MAG: Hpt domain-containing protein, partial [Planctomycetota bacterium]